MLFEHEQTEVELQSSEDLQSNPLPSVTDSQPTLFSCSFFLVFSLFDETFSTMPCGP